MSVRVCVRACVRAHCVCVCARVRAMFAIIFRNEVRAMSVILFRNNTSAPGVWYLEALVVEGRIFYHWMHVIFGALCEFSKIVIKQSSQRSSRSEFSKH